MTVAVDDPVETLQGTPLRGRALVREVEIFQDIPHAVRGEKFSAPFERGIRRLLRDHVKFPFQYLYVQPFAVRTLGEDGIFLRERLCELFVPIKRECGIFFVSDGAYAQRIFDIVGAENCFLFVRLIVNARDNVLAHLHGIRGAVLRFLSAA